MFKYYDILGISRHAGDAAIKHAYHAQSLKLHPDKPGGSKEKFQELDRVYKLLSDKKKREQYDLLGLDLGDSEEDSLESQVGALGFAVSQMTLLALARTALGGAFVLVFPHYWPFRWCQGVAGVGLYCSSFMRPRQRRKHPREMARTVGGHLMGLLAAGWLSYQTSFGRRWRMAWLYEARIVFIASGGTEKWQSALPEGFLVMQALGCFVAGRWLSTRHWRWASLAALELLVAIAAPCVCSVLGTQAANIADKKTEKYVEEVLKLMDVEAQEKLRLQSRISELQAALEAQREVEAKLNKKLEATNVKLDKYVDYSKKARGVVDRHVANGKRLQCRIDELESGSGRGKTK